MYVPNSQGNSVSYLGKTFFSLGPMPGFTGPPGLRIFNILFDYSATGIQGGPSDCSQDPTNGGSLMVIYPGAGQVASFAQTTTILQGTVSCPGNKIFASGDQ